MIPQYRSNKNKATHGCEARNQASPTDQIPWKLIRAPRRRRNVVYWNPNGRSSMISCTISPSKDTLRECLFSWYAFLCFNGLENFDIFYIRHNNIHGNDLLDPSVENLHLVCYTESLLVVLFLLPHKRGRNLK